MDARPFDVLSRTLASANTRRGVIGALATLPAGGWLANRDEAVARRGGRKRRNARGAHDDHDPAAEKYKKKK